jgi:hypothetical protein
MTDRVQNQGGIASLYKSMTITNGVDIIIFEKPLTLYMGLKPGVLPELSKNKKLQPVHVVS